MKLNMGGLDRVLRIMVAAIVIALYYTHIITSTVAIVAWVLSGIFILTGLIGFCPLYMPFGIHTNKK